MLHPHHLLRVLHLPVWNRERKGLQLLRVNEIRAAPAASPGTSGSSGPSRPAAPAPARPALRPACCAPDAARGSGSTCARRAGSPSRDAARAYFSTGISPKNAPLTSDTANANSSTTRVDARSRSPAAGRPGAAATSTRTAPYATADAEQLRPIMPSVTLSSSSSPAIRRQPAPSAARTASSCCRPSARTSRRFATFAHAISSTIPITPMRTHRNLLTSPITSCFKRPQIGKNVRVLEHLQGSAVWRLECRIHHGHQPREIRAGLRDRHPGFQPPHALEAEVSEVELVAVELKRNEDRWVRRSNRDGIHSAARR